jgi:polysaccharide export outer membrane protein
VAASLLALVATGCVRHLPVGPPAPPEPGTCACPTPGKPCGVEFRFGVGDQLEVNVWREEDLKTVQRVLPDGTISPPLLDPVPVAGSTIREVRARLAASYKEYVKEPVVSVRVTDVHSLRVAVLGEVKAPSVIPVEGPTTVLEAIARAGGFNEEVADKCLVRVIRPRPGGGPPIIYTAHSFQARVVLAPGDVVFVHPTSLAAWSRSLQLALAPVGALLGPVASAAATYAAVDAITN